MAMLINEFSWSFSRDRQFKDCLRSYYYQYYGSWGGWDKRADPEVRKLYLLKNMSSIDIWIGDIVHRTIKAILTSYKNGRSFSAEAAKQEAVNLFKTTYAQSAGRKWEIDIKNNLNLFEHYYGAELSSEYLKEKMQKAAKCINNFFAAGFVNDLQSREIIAVDEPDSFLINNVKVWAIPDYVRKKDKYVIYDWKTGQPSEKDLFQLSLYILYAKDKWGVDPENVEICPVYLSQDEIFKDNRNVTSKDELLVYVRESMSQMRGRLTDADVNKARIENFPKTEQTFRCKNCKFKEVCLS